MNNLPTFSKFRFNIQDARWANVTNQWKNFESLYPYNRLYFITEGEATISLKDTEITLKPGHCYLLPPFQVITANCASSMTHYFIHFKESERTVHSFLDFYKIPKEIKVDPELTLRLMQTAVANREQRTPEEYYYLHGAFDMLIAPFFTHAEPLVNVTPDLMHIIEYINAHLEENIKINDLADMMNLTVNHFSNVFKKAVGLSPKKYILQKKLDTAQALLADSNYNINEISHKLGFENETYFSRLFKEKIGFSPSEYKKQLHHTHEKN